MTTITTATIIITAPTTTAAASSTITAEMICAEVLRCRTRADGELPTLPQTPEFSDDYPERRTRCYWW